MSDSEIASDDGAADHADATRPFAPAPAPEADEGELRWVVEDMTADECQRRAQELSKDVDMSEMWPIEIACFVQANAALLNAPQPYLSHQISPMVGMACR